MRRVHIDRVQHSTALGRGMRDFTPSAGGGPVAPAGFAPRNLKRHP